MKNLLYIIGCFVGFISFAQDTLSTTTKNSKSTYLPERLGEGVNTTEYEEINPVLSSDGNTLYFARLNHPDNNYGEEGSQDIWYSEKDSTGNWAVAKRMPDHINNARYNAVFAVLDNGYSLLINGNFDRKGNWTKRGLAETHKIADEWSIPKSIKIKALSRKNRGQSFTAFMSADRSILITSFSKGYGSKKTDLYVSKKKLGKNSWTKPKKMKPMKHASSIEQAPFLSNDGDTLYFATNYSFDGYVTAGKKDFNIYYCVRKDDNYRYWTEPKLFENISPTKKYESDFVTNNTGEIGYYTSNMSGSSDIYQVRIFEKNPYVLLKGQVINMFKNAPIDNSVEYKIKIRRKVITSETEYVNNLDELPLEEMEIDTVMMIDSLSSFAFHLPFGNVYEIEVETMEFNTEPITINTYRDKEHRIVEKNLLVKPLDYAVLNGNVFDKKSDQPIEKELLNEVSIYVNGTAYDSVNIQEDGSFELKLSLREKYTLKAVLKGYDGLEETVDLSGNETYTQIKQKLYVQKQEDNFAYVNAELLNKNDSKPFTEEYHLFLDGNIYTDFLEKKEHSFVLKLELDKKYLVKLEAKDHITVFDTLDFTGKTKRLEIDKKYSMTILKEGEAIKLEHVYFDNAKATLKSTSYRELDQMVILLKENATLKIEISGHTDNKGTVKGNKKLSKERAKSVVEYLITKGIDEKRLTFKGYGSSQPVGDNNTEFGRQENRRVEFKILSK